ncbi:MAG: four helix bundle protein [Opitutales bacterium]|jgi:four helix bundle protein
MSESNPAAEKSYAFALRIIKLRRFLCEEKLEHDISKQILRCGTSIGATLVTLNKRTKIANGATLFSLIS